MSCWRFQIRLSWSGFSIQFRTGPKKSKKPVLPAAAPVPTHITRTLPTEPGQNPCSGTAPASLAATQQPRLPVRYVGYIAGFRFHDGPFILEKLRPGIILRVVRQPSNPHDSNAIQLFIGPYLLGYIPRGPNRELARRLDLAEALVCRITKVNAQEVPWNQVEIRIESLSIAEPGWIETNLEEISPRPVNHPTPYNFFSRLESHLNKNPLDSTS